MSVERWAKHLRVHIERERVELLVEWARKKETDNRQLLYERALIEFPMAGGQKARKYAEAALRKLVKTSGVRTKR